MKSPIAMMVVEGGKVMVENDMAKTMIHDRSFLNNCVMSECFFEYSCSDRYYVVHVTPVGQVQKKLLTFLDVTCERHYQAAAWYDSLTGLYNRLFFDQEFKKLSVRRSGKVMLFIIDLDGLKPINDRFGHAAGDLMIKNSAALFAHVFRREDMVARIGGDEFAALVVDPVDGLDVLIMKRLEGQPFSVGCVVTDCPFDPELVFKMADDRMYEQKRQKKIHVRP